MSKLAEGEEWADYQNQEDWPDKEATYEEPGEQGAICVGEGLSAVSARAKAASRAAQKLQKDFEAGKLWKRPQKFWCKASELEVILPRESSTKELWFVDIKDVGETTRLFTPRIPTSSIFGQRWALKDTPTGCSWMLGSLRDYLVPHGQKPYPLWDQATWEDQGC